MSRRTPIFLLATFVCGLALGGCAGCDGEDARGADAFEFAPDTDDVSYRPGWELQTVAGGGRAKIDLLWVIDNSSSMCSEQLALRESFPSFIDRLTEEPVDFHIAVTTTHNIYGTEPLPGQPYVDRHLFTSDGSPSEDSPGAPVAEAGQIQRFPNPTLGIDDACLSGPHSNEEDDVDERSIQRVETQLNRAIACTKNPAQYEQFSDDVVDGTFEELTECALFDEPETGGGEDDRGICEHIGKSDDYGVEELTAEIFPCGQKLGKPCKTPEEFRQVYRELPTILRSRDYTGSDGLLDESEIQELRRDFACMSLVGTRGSDYEQGLRNAALAVHPLMTGGPAGDPITGRTFEHPVTGEKRTIEDGTSRPNHGFLRSDAATALIFVTDENDCSHPNHAVRKRALENGCGEANCYFPTAEGSPNKDDLLPTDRLYERFVDNLEQSRRRDDLSQSDLIVASFHGNPARYASSEHPLSARHPLPKPGTQCGEAGFPSRSELVDNRLPVCTASLGTANSGDRYAEFLDRADDDDFGTYPSSPLQQGSGGICTSRQPEDALLGPLRSMAEHPGGRISGCLNHRVLRCQNASDCPAFDPEVDAGHGDICRTWGQPGEGHGNFCASAIRVLMRPTENRTVDELSEGNREVFEEYCVASSVGEALARGCVVKRGKYEWRPCRSNDRSMELRWKELERRDPKFVFSEFQVAVAYRPAEDSGDDGPHSASGAP